MPATKRKRKPLTQRQRKELLAARRDRNRCVSNPPDWWATFELAAKAAGMPLSEWIGKACVAQLPATMRRQLSKRPPANRPRAGGK